MASLFISFLLHKRTRKKVKARKENGLVFFCLGPWGPAELVSCGGHCEHGLACPWGRGMSAGLQAATLPCVSPCWSPVPWPQCGLETGGISLGRGWGGEGELGPWGQCRVQPVTCLPPALVPCSSIRPSSPRSRQRQTPGILMRNSRLR